MAKKTEVKTASVRGRRYFVTRRFSIVPLVVLALVDLILDLIIKKLKKKKTVTGTPETIVVSKIDHLGDLVTALPALRYLRQKFHLSHIILICNKDASELADVLRSTGYFDRVMPITSFWLTRERRSVRKFFSAAYSQTKVLVECRNFRVGLFVDLRPFSPNGIWLGVAIGASVRVGFNSRGLGPLLTREVEYIHDDGIHANLEKCVTGCDQPEPGFHSLPLVQVEKIPWEGNRPGGYAIVQVSSARREKNISASSWLRIISNCPPLPIYIVGGREDFEFSMFIVKRLAVERSIKNRCGQLSLKELFSVVGGASYVIAPDSFVAHIAYAVNVHCTVVAPDGWDPSPWYPRKSDSFRFLKIVDK